MLKSLRLKMIHSFGENLAPYVIFKITCAVFISLFLMQCSGGGDSNNSGDSVSPQVSQIDNDKDGFFAKFGNDPYVYPDDQIALIDCDDNDASIYPGAGEIRDDGIDQNCDGKDLSSEIPVDPTTCKNSLDCDGDGLINSCDQNPNDPNVVTPKSDCDVDNDGHIDISCKDYFDKDGNGFLSDSEYEEAGIFCDNCVLYNPDQADLDYNGVGDACQSCPLETEDKDGDCIKDTQDNCPNIYNPDQSLDNCLDPNQGVFVAGDCQLNDDEGNGSYTKPYRSLSSALRHLGSKSKIYVLNTYSCAKENLILDMPVEILGGWYCVEGSCDDISKIKRHKPSSVYQIKSSYENGYYPTIKGSYTAPTIRIKNKVLLERLYIEAPESYDGSSAVSIENAQGILRSNYIKYPTGNTCIDDDCYHVAVNVNLETSHLPEILDNFIEAGDLSPQSYNYDDMYPHTYGIKASIDAGKRMTVLRNLIHVGSSYYDSIGIGLNLLHLWHTSNATTIIEKNDIQIEPSGYGTGIFNSGHDNVQILRNHIVVKSKYYNILSEEDPYMMTINSYGIKVLGTGYQKSPLIALNHVKSSLDVMPYRNAAIYIKGSQVDIYANTLKVAKGALLSTGVFVESGQFDLQSNILLAHEGAQSALRYFENAEFTWTIKNNLFDKSFSYFGIATNDGPSPFNEVQKGWNYFESQMSQWESIADNIVTLDLGLTDYDVPLEGSIAIHNGIYFNSSSLHKDISYWDRLNPPTIGAYESVHNFNYENLLFNLDLTQTPILKPRLNYHFNNL